MHVPCVFLLPRDTPFFWRLRGSVRALQDKSHECGCRANSSQRLPKNLHGKPTMRPHHFPPVARNDRARQGSVPRLYILTPLHQLLRKFDWTTVMQVGRWNVREPRRRVLRHHTLGEVKVCGVPHRLGRGAVGNFSVVCKLPLVPLAWRSSHPTCVITDGVE